MKGLAFFIVATHFAAVLSECPDGWVVFEGSCYHFGHTASSFTEAEHYCGQHKSNLVHVNNADETVFLKSFLADLKQAKHWIGCTDRDIEKIWTWTDDGTRATYNDWHKGEPNQGKGANCVVLRSDFQYQWTDDPCNENYYPICEKPIETSEILG